MFYQKLKFYSNLGNTLKRLSENKAFNKILDRYKFTVSYDEYIEWKFQYKFKEGDEDEENS